MGELIKYSKNVCEFESVSIVTNGSKITEEWMSTYGQYLSIIAISCDSFDAATNMVIGRHDGRGDTQGTYAQLLRIKAWCATYKVQIKINTVVSVFNMAEDMVVGSCLY